MKLCKLAAVGILIFTEKVQAFSTPHKKVALLLGKRTSQFRTSLQKPHNELVSLKTSCVVSGVSRMTKTTTSLGSLSEATNVLAMAAATTTIIPLKEISLACFVPTLLGYYKSEYGVLFAYRLATSISAFLIFTVTLGVTAIPDSVAAWHAAAL
jgi:hypothetical protein